MWGRDRRIEETRKYWLMLSYSFCVSFNSNVMKGGKNYVFINFWIGQLNTTVRKMATTSMKKYHFILAACVSFFHFNRLLRRQLLRHFGFGRFTWRLRSSRSPPPHKLEVKMALEAPVVLTAILLLVFLSISGRTVACISSWCNYSKTGTFPPQPLHSHPVFIAEFFCECGGRLQWEKLEARCRVTLMAVCFKTEKINNCWSIIKMREVLSKEYIYKKKNLKVPMLAQLLLSCPWKYMNTCSERRLEFLVSAIVMVIYLWLWSTDIYKDLLESQPVLWRLFLQWLLT